MDFNLNFHPLDNLIKDKSIFWLEALVPFIDYKFKRYLIIYIKYKELTSMLETLEDREYVGSCGFNCKASSIDDVINGLAGFMPRDFSENIIQMKKMLDMMKVMNQMEQKEDRNHHSSNHSNDFNNINSLMGMLGQGTQAGSGSGSSDMYDSVMSILDQY